MIGACILPGPAVLLFRRLVHSARIKTTIIKIEITDPLAWLVSCERPSVVPFFNINVPVATPRINPINATHAFRSPADIRITIRNGHPKNTREPIIIIIPRIKRIIGDDPAVERYSFVATEIIKEPSTSPMISGLAYCTASAWCIPSEPAISRTKQAIQNAMFAGLPRNARTAATTPQPAPASASFFFESHKVIFVPSLS